MRVQTWCYLSINPPDRLVNEQEPQLPLGLIAGWLAFCRMLKRCFVPSHFQIQVLGLSNSYVLILSSLFKICGLQKKAFWSRGASFRSILQTAEASSSCPFLPSLWSDTCRLWGTKPCWTWGSSSAAGAAAPGIPWCLQINSGAGILIPVISPNL